MNPSLYGITHSNRNYSDPYYWGKNQFNSSFPVALACYMRDKDVKALYIVASEDQKTAVTEVSFNEIFGTDLSNERIRFNFESVFTPYNIFVEDALEKIDVVISTVDGIPIRALEVKLTTLPDDGTSSYSEDLYGTEIVVRSPTMRYMALSMVEACGDAERDTVREIFSSACGRIRSWENVEEMNSRKKDIFLSIENFLKKYAFRQRPLVLQPIWKTKGKSSILADNCLDVFVWSDFALARLFMDSIEPQSSKIKRQERAALRLARFLFEWARSGKVYQQPIYDGMTFNTLNDKEFAVSGRVTNQHMRCARLLMPAVRKEEIKRIILGGGQRFLSPERRFDAIIYFSNDLFEEH